MASDTTPLLAPARPPGRSQRPDNRAEKIVPPRNPHWAARLQQLLLFFWAVLATAGVLVLAFWVQHLRQSSQVLPSPSRSSSGKRNLIFMVSDGMGPASLSLTRSYRQLVEGRPINDTLALDRHFWGTSRTRSSNSLVTDSAAGATAFSCGEKSYNSAISILPDFSPCGTVLEAAKRAGYHTGLVVTTDITDATPACFASHVKYRSQMDEIAMHEIGEGPLGHVVDLMLGGGRCHFLPNSSEGSCRQDDVSPAAIAELNGWAYVDSRPGFDSLQLGNNLTLPTLGLFAAADIPFEIDRSNMSDVYPSLSEMAATALRALEHATKHSDKGFFLMIEGSRIDHAGHINDPAAQVREVLEYDKTFQLVLDFLEQSHDEGVVVSTSDHETGGLSTALQEPGHLPVYDWYPSFLVNAKASSEHLARLLRAHVASISPESKKDETAYLASLKEWVNVHLIMPHLGITDALDEELQLVAETPEDAATAFAAIVSLRSHIGWSTHGHSAVDVNIYSSGGPAAEPLHGNCENTDIGKFLREYLGVAVDDITQELKEKMRPALVDTAAPAKTIVGFEMEGHDPAWVDTHSPPHEEHDLHRDEHRLHLDD